MSKSVEDPCTQNPVRPIMSNGIFRVPEDNEVTEEDLMCSPCGGEYGRRDVRVKRGPKDPTAEEIEEHNACHVPYRSWCPHCVAAAGKASAHHRGPERDEPAVPYHHVDHWFMRDERGGNSVPVVVIKDSDTKAIGAHVVTQKGNIDWVADIRCEDIEN